MSFSICQIRHVLAAADHGSFYKAARALGMEQSTLSRDVAKLERMIGVQIFVRSRAGISTTGAGRDFIRCVRPMLANADKLVAIMRAAGQGRAGDLVIGHYCSLSAGNLRATMLGWRGAHPDVNLDGIEANRGALLAGLDTGEIDIAIMAGEAAHDGYQREAFWSERVMVALSSSHPLAEREIIHWTDLRSERFLLPATDPGPEIRDMLLGRLSVAGMQPDVRMHQSGHGTILSVLGDGRGLSIICEGGSGTQYPNVVYRPMYGEQGPVLICYSGYWRDENCNPALRRFLQFVKTRYALSFKISENSVEQGQFSLERNAMSQGKPLIIVLVALVFGFAGGFILRPIITPAPQTAAVASPATVAPTSTEARGTQYFVAHVDEARRIVAGCRDGSVRGGECASAEQAVAEVEGRERFKKFMGN